MGDFGQKIIKIRVAKNAEKGYYIDLKVKSALSAVIQLKQGLKQKIETAKYLKIILSAVIQLKQGLKLMKDMKEMNSITSFSSYPIKTRIETFQYITRCRKISIFQQLSN